MTADPAGWDEGGSGDAAAAGPDRALLDERAFLLRSLRDLEEERAAGDIDDADYQALRSRYTARAAAVLRALQHTGDPVPDGSPATAATNGVGGAPGADGATGPDGGGPATVPAVDAPDVDAAAVDARGVGVAAVDAPPGRGPLRRWLRKGTPAQQRRRRRFLVSGAVVCFALAAVVLITGALGVALPGDPVTGTITLTTQQQVQRLLAQAEDALLESHQADAEAAFQQVLAIDPTQVEALSEAGWLQFAAGVRGHNRTLVRRGQADEDRAVSRAPGQAGPRFYLGAMLAQEDQYQQAVAQFEAGLGDKPPATTVAVFAPTIDAAFGRADVPVPASVGADVAAVQAEASSGSGSSGTAGS